MRWRSLKKSSAIAALTTATLPLTRWINLLMLTFIIMVGFDHDHYDQLLQQCHGGDLDQHHYNLPASSSDQLYELHNLINLVICSAF